MQKFEVMIDVVGSVHLDIEADSHEEAYEKALEWFENEKTIETIWLYEQYYFVEDEHGYQCEF